MDHIYAMIAIWFAISIFITLAFMTRPSAPWRQVKRYTPSDYESFRQTRMGAKDTYNWEE